MGEQSSRPAVSAGWLQRSLGPTRRLGAAAASPGPPPSSPVDVPYSSFSCGGVPSASLDAVLTSEALIDCIPDPFCLVKSNRQIARMNPAFQKLFEIPLEEISYEELTALIVPPDRLAENTWIHQQFSRGERVKLETTRLRKDGAPLEVSLSGAPLQSGNRVTAFALLYRDISEHRRDQTLNSALFRIAEKSGSAVDLGQFYQAIHAIIGELMDARNFYIAVYDRASQLLTFPYFRDEQDGPPAPRPLRRGLTEYVLRTGEPLLCTPEVFAVLVSQGEVELLGAPSLDWMGIPLKTGSQTCGAIVVQSYSESMRYGEPEKEILTFVSQHLAAAIEHKRHAEDLGRSEARYRSLFESAAYGIYRSDAAGKFLDVNPALVSLLGYGTAEEVLALDPPVDVFADPADSESLWRRFQHSGPGDGAEVRWKRKDGSRITVRLSGQSVPPADGGVEVLEIMAEDVTERRALEEQFRQAQKMEAVGRLAGGIAHDFNNLLMVISGYTEVLLEHTSRESVLYPKMEAVQQAADRASRLTHQLLAFSRKQVTELKVVDVNAIVGDMERLLHPLIGETIELRTQLDVNLGHTRADAGQIEQVLMNLVVNAKDAMPDGGTITLRTANVRLDDEARREYGSIRPGAYVMLSVSDTGCGMDMETRSRIFEPFFTTKEKGKGTGLGLSTVYGIIKQLSGYVFVQTEPERGSTFIIYLPLIEEAAEANSPAQEEKRVNGGGETILLVEDEESVRQLVGETLTARGYRVLEAEQGEAALRIVAERKDPIEMLITDIVMPGIGGRELAQKLCADDPAMKVLFLSGYTEDTIVHQGGLDPGTAFLQKPFTLQMLVRKVQETLRTGLPGLKMNAQSA